MMGLMTKNIGHSGVSSTINLTSKAEIKRVLICRPNHRLGNLLLITPLVQEVIDTFPNCKIDLFVKGGLAPIIFKNYKNIDRVIQLPKKPFKNFIQYIQGWASLKKQHYDLAINVVRNSSSGKLSVELADSTYKIFGNDTLDIQFQEKDFAHVAKYSIYELRSFLHRIGIPINKKPPSSLDLKLTPLEIAEGKQALNKLANAQKKTICLFTYATGEKCYSESWWAGFYERLKTEYPNHNFVEVLPIENISKLSFKIPTFYSKDIREIGSFIANTGVFIGADSGIMHLASAVHTPTVGLFSITDPNTFQPYNNNSIGINTTVHNTDECIEILNKIIYKV